MRTNDYEEAEMIELHDAGVVVHVKSYGDANIGWTSDAELTCESYHIQGPAIDDLLNRAGIRPRLMDKNDPCSGKTRPVHESAPHIEIHKQREAVGSGGFILGYALKRTIEKLWVKIEKPQLIHIRIMYLCDEGAPDECEVYQETTYSGSFNVWWSKQEIVDRNIGVERGEAGAR